MFKKLIIASMLVSLPLVATESIGIVTKVTDGDTLHVMIGKKEEKVRILYIDTPEKYSGSKLDKDAKKAGISANDEQELGKLASGYASKFFQNGDKVVIESEKKDQYGRLLATVNKNGVNYSKQIIKDGYACIYKKASYPGELEKALKSAKDEKKGLWSINYDVMNKLCK
ncbi:thermonuclease family protein [Sulfurospirillum oryzae]|uniref:thermonuclease family protein n=1 Tax=Sulfurospirillum oryzae TaxID=2976535 RepID=UPI0021E97100|nr:thermonuclease family protein [Sulfurospirillum oryzae]